MFTFQLTMDLKDIISKHISFRPEKKIPELTSFTVMISRGMGRVRSFSFSSRLLLWASAIFALYIVVTALGISLYLKGLWNETVQSDRVKQLAYETEETKRSLYQARQRLKLLEETICNLQGKKKKEVSTSKPEVAPPALKESVFQEKGVEDPANGPFSESPLAIERLKTKRSGDRLSVNFRLVRTRPDGNPFGGHLFIIAANTASDPTRFWTHAGVALKDGVPVDYKRGQVFKVRNYRIIQRSLVVDSPSETPSLLSILAYDTSGTLILHKDYAIEEAP